MMSSTIRSLLPPSSSWLSSVMVTMRFAHYLMLVLRWKVMSALLCIPKISGGSWSGRAWIYSIQLAKLPVGFTCGIY